MRFKLGILTVLAATFLASTMAIAAEEPSEQVKRMDAAATVLDEIMGTPDKGIPEELLDSAKCVAVIPSMIKIGFVFGWAPRERNRDLPHQFWMERSGAFLCHWR